MSDAPERIAVWPDFVGHPSMTGQWSANTHPDNAVAYVRADLSDALLREAVEALDDARQSLVDSSEEIAELRLTLSKTDLELPWLSDAIDKQTIALAKLRAHLEGEKE
jgi:hypothetical protein